jgi:uncharacterized protein (TIGR02391 family)
VSLIELIPDADAVCALEPDELGLRMLPMMAMRERQAGIYSPGIQLADFISSDQVRGYGGQEEQVKLAIREAWAWPEGAALLIDHPRFHGNTTKLLSRRARRLSKEDPNRALSARRLPKEVLHPSIREDVWALYHRDEYDTAVFKAMKAVEVAVRDAAGLSSGDIGVKLMGKAFNSETGPLTDMEVKKSERDARCALFVGAIGSYKNPHLHRYVDLDDPDEAAEVIMLAAHLLRIVDTRCEARQGSSSSSGPEAAG